jgi:hypothetical protein
VCQICAKKRGVKYGLLLNWQVKSRAEVGAGALLDHKAAKREIPARRMKRTQMHPIPLSRQAVAILDELRLLGGGQYVFAYLHLTGVVDCDVQGQIEPTLRETARRLMEKALHCAGRVLLRSGAT